MNRSSSLPLSTGVITCIAVAADNLHSVVLCGAGVVVVRPMEEGVLTCLTESSGAAAVKNHGSVTASKAHLLGH